MPVIRIDDAAFADLKSLATWFGTKTPGDTISRIVQEAMGQLGMERGDESEELINKTGTGAMEFDRAPGLSFTKPLAASVNGKAIPKPRWSAILLAVIAQVKAKGFKGEKLVQELKIPTKATQYVEEGYKYYPNLGVSIQGQSASEAWKEVDRLAKKWRIPVTVEFWWRKNQKAQYPGKTGVLRTGNATD